MIFHSRPSLGEEEAAAVAAVAATGQLAQGERVAAFEADFACFHGLGRAVAVNSGTSALHLALLALGIGAGDEVIVPDLVCTALLNAVHYTGATPVIADVDPEDYNLSLADTKRRLTKRTRAIILPHMFGTPARETQRFMELGVPVLEDCAQAVGGTVGGCPVGTLGTLGIFSFYATKVFATGEGGMVVSSSEALLDAVRDLRDYDNREDYRTRYNYKMTEMQGALGVVQLKKLPGFIARRRLIAAHYSQAFSDLPVRLPLQLEGVEGIYYRFVLCCDKAQELMEFLRANGISAVKPIFRPLHQFVSSPQGVCPVTEQVWRDSVSLPIYPSLTDADIAQVVKFTRKFFC